MVSQIDMKVEENWYYNERHHGKVRIGDIDGTTKNKVYRDVMPNKCLIRIQNILRSMQTNHQRHNINLHGRK